MAVKNINDLTGPVGMTTSKTTNQDKERMDYFTTPLVTATDFDPAFNELGPLDYADRIDDSKKTSKPSLATRAIKGIISAVNPLKKGKFLMNLAMSSPDFAKNIITKSDDVASTVSKSKVNDEFLELFENQKKTVNRVGRLKASAILDEFNKLDENLVLGGSSADLIEALANKGIQANDNIILRMRGLYKKYKDLATGKKGISQYINFDDPKVSNIMESILLGDKKKWEAAEMLEDLFPKSGFVDISTVKTLGHSKASGKFSKFYEKYIDQLEDATLKEIATEGVKTPRFYFNRVSVGEKITGKAVPTLRSSAIFDDTGKTFTQTRTSFLNNDIAKTLINKTKNLFQDKSTQIFDVDHIQAPRFGGTNAENNLRLITKADHVSLKTLPTNKTLATDVVKAKSGFENEYYNLSTKLIDNIKNNNYVAADKIAESLRVMVDNFKNTYKNVDFVVGTPHVAIKTGDNTAKYIKYGDDVKLSTKQKNYIENNNLLPEQSNLPNAGKPIEKQAEDIYQGYLQIYNLIGEIPSGSIGKVAGDIKSMDVPLPKDITVRKDLSQRLKDGGIVGISHLIRPL